MSNSDNEKLYHLLMFHYWTYDDIFVKRKAEREISTEDNQDYLFEEVAFIFSGLE